MILEDCTIELKRLDVHSSDIARRIGYMLNEDAWRHPCILVQWWRARPRIVLWSIPTLPTECYTFLFAFRVAPYKMSDPSIDQQRKLSSNGPIYLNQLPVPCFPNVQRNSPHLSRWVGTSQRSTIPTPSNMQTTDPSDYWAGRISLFWDHCLRVQVSIALGTQSGAHND